MNKDIYNFINKFWQFIKHTEIPPQSDQNAWDQIVDEITELTKEYPGNDPLPKLFRAWATAYLNYMNSISRGESADG